MNEYTELIRVKQNLKLKISKEIETRKNTIAQLKTEILEARKYCKTLQNALGNPTF
jgi:predicted RNase H-like nuclease (RuvC/YqgF family)